MSCFTVYSQSVQGQPCLLSPFGGVLLTAALTILAGSIRIRVPSVVTSSLWWHLLASLVIGWVNPWLSHLSLRLSMRYVGSCELCEVTCFIGRRPRAARHIAGLSPRWRCFSSTRFFPTIQNTLFALFSCIISSLSKASSFLMVLTTDHVAELIAFRQFLGTSMHLWRWHSVAYQHD